MNKCSRTQTTRGWRWLGWLLLAGYGVFLGARFAPIAAGADSGGYLNSARLLAEGKWRVPLRTVPELPLASAGPFTYVPLGFTDEHRTGVLTPTYPVGLPLHYALFGKIAGWRWGTTAVGVLAALAAVACTFGAARELGVGPPIAFVVESALAMSPLFLFTSLVPLSDTVATAWCAATVWLSLRGRRHFGWAVAAGFALSVAMLVRPTNVLLAPVVALILWGWRGWLASAVGAAPGLIFGLLYNRAMFGHPLASGYGPVTELFHREYLAGALSNYAVTLPNVLPLAIVAVLLLPWLPWRSHGRELAACLLWFLIFAGFYAFYEFTKLTWWYLRFILPAFPALLILAGVGLSRLAERAPVARAGRAQLAAAALALVLSLTVSVRWSRIQHVLAFPEEQRPHVAAAEWAKANLPRDAVVFCFHLSSALYFYTDFPILRSDQISPEDFNRFAARTKETGRPVYAAIFHFDQADTFRDHLPGPWEKVTDIYDVGIWKLSAGR